MKNIIRTIMLYMHKRHLVWLVAVLPLIFCISIPLVLLSGDVQQMGKCFLCRIMAFLTKDSSNRLC